MSSVVFVSAVYIVFVIQLGGSLWYVDVCKGVTISIEPKVYILEELEITSEISEVWMEAPCLIQVKCRTGS